MLGAETKVMNGRLSLPSGGSEPRGGDRCTLTKVQGRLTNTVIEVDRAGNGNPKEGIEKASWRPGDILTSLRGEVGFSSME